MTIQILNEVWDVYIVPPYSPYLNGHLGVCDGYNNVIFIANGLNIDKFQEVLQHEISHAIAIITNAPLFLSEENMAGFNGMYADEIAEYAREVMLEYGFY